MANNLKIPSYKAQDKPLWQETIIDELKRRVGILHNSPTVKLIASDMNSKLLVLSYLKSQKTHK